MIVNVKDILADAKKGGYAVGAFNTVNLETTQAILKAAYELRSPVIIQVTEKTMDYTGGRAIFNLIKNIAEFYYPNVPVGIHLDHGKSFEVIERAVEVGITSVMYDGSRKNYADNVAMTKKIAEFCKGKGVHIQAELGNVPYFGEVGVIDINWDDYMTDPAQAEKFVQETGVDALAVAVGNAHDFAKEREIPDFARLEMIRKVVDVPLIMHGASDWTAEKAKEAIEKGISCFNVDTAIRLAFVNSLINRVKNKEEMSFDLRKILGESRDQVEDAVKDKIKIFGSDGRA
ncbi:MAG: class II fructose-bisphosphate aldolase [Candidatus Moranbacteria bacterium]|nr:class II fructose-bisphosphate aldolase [Candidatus Moranbacteria bacterium]